MTPAEAQDCCREWQKRLRLQDWDVQVELVRHWDMENGVLGNIAPSLEHKTAVVRLLDECDIDERRWPQPIEQTIVHELLHLHFEPFWNDDKKTEMEQAINMIAGAFCDV